MPPGSPDYVAATPMVATKEEKKHAAKVLRRLENDYPDANCELEFTTPLQLLIATILSAQCTDQRVNIVTRELFENYKTATDFATASIRALEKAIQSTGFFRNKAKNIRSCCADLVEHHDGQVPQDLDALVRLAGVGRKTANVVMGTAFGIPSGVVVDTHVGRISRRLGLTAETDPVKVERDLMKQLPKRRWIKYSHQLIHHGRKVCKARRPLCENCSLLDICPQIEVG